MNKRRVDLDKLKNAIQSSNTKSEAIRKLGLTPSGGNWRTFTRWIKKYNLDVSHFRDGRGWAKGISKPFRGRLSDKEIFVKNSKVATNTVRKRLLKEGRGNYCELCKIKDWLGKPLTFHLDHIDGDHTNNLRNNLRFLCPNCHQQTETWGAPNIKHIQNKCIDCSSQITTKAKRCKSCECKNRKQTKIVWPSHESLVIMIEKNGYTGTGRILGVSDNAIRKHLKEKI